MIWRLRFSQSKPRLLYTSFHPSHHTQTKERSRNLINFLIPIFIFPGKYISLNYNETTLSSRFYHSETGVRLNESLDSPSLTESRVLSPMEGRRLTFGHETVGPDLRNPQWSYLSDVSGPTRLPSIRPSFAPVSSWSTFSLLFSLRCVITIEFYRYSCIPRARTSKDF